MQLITVCRSDELALGEMKALSAGSVKVVVYHLSDGYFATQASCSHLFAPLGKGKLREDCKIKCPLHRATFDIRTGKVIQWANFPPGIQLLNGIRGEKPLTTYPVTLEGDEVRVSVPSA